MDTARRQLLVARHTAAGGFHDAAVLHAEQGTQCALKALLHAVGAPAQARGHSLLDLASACERAAGMVLDQRLREALGDLAAQYQPSRYPDALPGGTAADHYGAGASERSIATAESVLGRVALQFDRLRQVETTATDDRDKDR